MVRLIHFDSFFVPKVLSYQKLKLGMKFANVYRYKISEEDFNV